MICFLLPYSLMNVSKQILFAGLCAGVAAEVMELSGGDDGGKYKYDINTDINTVMYHPTSAFSLLEVNRLLDNLSPH